MLTFRFWKKFECNKEMFTNDRQAFFLHYNFKIKNEIRWSTVHLHYIWDLQLFLNLKKIETTIFSARKEKIRISIRNSVCLYHVRRKSLYRCSADTAEYCTTNNVQYMYKKFIYSIYNFTFVAFLGNLHLQKRNY